MKPRPMITIPVVRIPLITPQVAPRSVLTSDMNWASRGTSLSITILKTSSSTPNGTIRPSAQAMLGMYLINSPSVSGSHNANEIAPTAITISMCMNAEKSP